MGVVGSTSTAHNRLTFAAADDAQFGVTIDYVRGKSDPVQVFSAMTELLRGFSEIDRKLIGVVAPGASPSTVIEDIEAASITAWIRSLLSKADDEAIKSMDVKKAVGVYLVKAKYAIIRFLDDQKAREDVKRRRQLKDDLTALARELPQAEIVPPEVDLAALEAPINEIQKAKARLQNGEALTVKGAGQPDLRVDTSTTGSIEFVPKTAETEDVDGGFAEMLLLIRKPDLIGRSKWEFKHGKQSVSAGIADEGWMSRFHLGQVGTIVPGAEMRARVRLKYQRDANGALTGVEHEVVSVLGIVPPSPAVQAALFSD